jgi:hypothetical protein
LKNSELKLLEWKLGTSYNPLIRFKGLSIQKMLATALTRQSKACELCEPLNEHYGYHSSHNNMNRKLGIASASYIRMYDLKVEQEGDNYRLIPMRLKDKLQ